MTPANTATSLRHRVGRGFIIVMAVLAVLLTFITIALVAFIRRGDDVIHRWQPAVSTSQNLLADLVNQETGVRGYALGRQPDFLQPYNSYRAQENKDASQLRALVAGHHNLLSDLDAFEAAVRSWRTDFAQPIIDRVRTDPAAAFPLAIDQAAKASFDNLRDTSARLTNDIRAERKRATSQRIHSIVYVWIALGSTGALVLIAGLITWRGLRRSILDPVELLAEQTRAVAAGDTERAIVATGPPEIAGLGADVERMRAWITAELARVEVTSKQLLARSEDLARSNADLEQFAYIASHDLSEPLRKVANFCQLLERQYGPQLDEKAQRYIDYAVDGAKRMQILIGDLLAFSRVGRATSGFADVDMDSALNRGIANIENRIAESGAEIVRGPMPTVHGDPTLLAALFQNLVGNSVKYRSEARPRIEISAARDGDAWLFTVSDNGIGIEQKYAERIFAIFQRLHLRDEYGGTGIGLALCRKIVEFHRGRIWLAETDDAGATFQFSIPDDSDTH